MGIFAPLLIAKRKRESNTFLRSDLISGTASVIIFSLAYMMTWNPVMGLIASLVLMIPLSVKSAEPGKLLISLFKKLLPSNLRNHSKSVAIILSALIAFLVISLTYHVTPPVLVILEVCLVVVIFILALSKFGSEPLKSFVKENILAQQNRTAVAIAIGSAAIVSAIVLGNTGQNNQPASNGTPEMVRGVPVRHALMQQQLYECPVGYVHKKGVVIFGNTGTDPWCYKKN